MCNIILKWILSLSILALPKLTKNKKKVIVFSNYCTRENLDKSQTQELYCINNLNNTRLKTLEIVKLATLSYLITK